MAAMLLCGACKGDYGTACEAALAEADSSCASNQCSSLGSLAEEPSDEGDAPEDVFVGGCGQGEVYRCTEASWTGYTCAPLAPSR